MHTKKGSILAIDDIEYKASVGKSRADVSNHLAVLTPETDANFIEQLQRLLNVSNKPDESTFDVPADFQPIPNSNLNENSNFPAASNGTGDEVADLDDSPPPEQQQLKIPPLPLFDPLGTFNEKIQKQNSGGAADDGSIDRMCKFASCDFNALDRLCNYIDGTKIGDAKWAFSTSRVGNRLTGINADASGSK